MVGWGQPQCSRGARSAEADDRRSMWTLKPSGKAPPTAASHRRGRRPDRLHDRERLLIGPKVPPGAVAVRRGAGAGGGGAGATHSGRPGGAAPAGAAPAPAGAWAGAGRASCPSTGPGLRPPPAETIFCASELGRRRSPPATSLCYFFCCGLIPGGGGLHHLRGPAVCAFPPPAPDSAVLSLPFPPKEGLQLGPAWHCLAGSCLGQQPVLVAGTLEPGRRAPGEGRARRTNGTAGYRTATLPSAEPRARPGEGNQEERSAMHAMLAWRFSSGGWRWELNA